MTEVESFRAALIQTCTSADLERNLAQVTRQIHEAADAGAAYIQTPEVTNMMAHRGAIQLENCQPDDGANVAVNHFADVAAECRVWLHIGSIAVRLSDELLANRSFLFAPDGQVAARYDKIHMFDVSVDEDNRYSESRRYAPGDRAVVVSLPWISLGLTICYDMRFPGLYRDLAKAGAQMIAVPSAFTVPTGKAHWHALLRARAIEAQSFILAAAQAGEHESGRKTYGHSIVISPWGEVLAEADGLNTTVIYADIRAAEVVAARDRIPSLMNDRPYQVAWAEKLERQRAKLKTEHYDPLST
ncbi:MAG: carbon-nitrogen hydrolase family protein [Hyphomicrobiaceae bacterium]